MGEFLNHFWVQPLRLFTYIFAFIIKIDFLNVFVIPIFLRWQWTVVTVITVNTTTFTAFFAVCNYCRFLVFGMRTHWIVHNRAHVIFTNQVSLVDIHDMEIVFTSIHDVFRNDLHMFVSVWSSMFMPESDCMHQLMYDSKWCWIAWCLGVLCIFFFFFIFIMFTKSLCMC